jgi:hypothetical protein
MTKLKNRLWIAVGLWFSQAAAYADPASLDGTVMCGYQGWFATEGDGMKRGWQHYGFNKEGRCHIDLWPDVSEHGADELYTTPLQFADGSPAQVFSSANPKTVSRHFQWMKAHQIDGVFLQRFATTTRGGDSLAFVDKVMANVREAARESGRAWCVMYDLSGLKKGEIESIVMPDWRRLREELRITSDPTYQKHNGKPVVAVWGIGFNDDRAYTLDESGALLRFLKTEFGGATVMAGVPFGWRELNRDSVKDPHLHEVLADADIISPWAVGRYGTVEGATRDIEKVHAGDAVWCQDRSKGYLPVIFPGFSWHNLMQARGQEAKVNAIPRLKGQFYWHQAMRRIQAGSKMLYVAMFDEMDEGTAIFKCANTTPAGEAKFATYEGLPSDHYLWLTSQIRRVLRGQQAATPWLPSR